MILDLSIKEGFSSQSSIKIPPGKDIYGQENNYAEINATIGKNR